MADDYEPSRGESTGGEQGPTAKFSAEVDLLLGADTGVAISPTSWSRDGNYDYLYVKKQFLVADRDLERGLRALGEAGASGRVVDSLVDGVNLVESSVDDIGPVLARVDAALGPGVVTPNHVLTICPKGSGLCPATEPLSVPAEAPPYPAESSVKEGKGVRVAVVDTGLLHSADTHPWLTGVFADPPDIDPQHSWHVPANDPEGVDIDPYAGHGTFIAGVIKCIAPGTQVSVERVVVKAGVVNEFQLIKQLDDALAKSPDIISFSAGGYTRRNVPPKSFVEFYENRLRHHKGVILVAAAGNDATRTPFWPAAFPWAVSVGSVDGSGRRRSSFSNFGGWVDVYAPGEDLVNAYASGKYRTVVAPHVIREFFGMCEWSGTSFSTPVVAGLIAARMARSGENGQQAAKKLLKAARIQAIPGVGPRLWF